MKNATQTFYQGDRLLLPEELEIGQTRVVQIALEDREEEVVLLRTLQGHLAYLNRCRHLPVSLDWGDGDVLDESGKLLQCRTHGAMFRPQDGLCVAGPCQGLSLFPVEVCEDETGVYLA